MSDLPEVGSRPPLSAGLGLGPAGARVDVGAPGPLLVSRLSSIRPQRNGSRAYADRWRKFPSEPARVWITSSPARLWLR
jgi:hypothetical protein